MCLASFCPLLLSVALVLSQCTLDGHPSCKSFEILTFWLLSQHTLYCLVTLAWPGLQDAAAVFEVASFLIGWLRLVLCRLMGPLATCKVLPLVF